jgi:phage baseplate assembly protein gpV
VNENAPDDDHMDGLAQAELDRRSAREVTLWAVTEGDPRLRPGTPMEVSGIDGSIAGRYVLTSVTHTVDPQRGFLSEISTVPPPPHRPRRQGVVATVGEVTDVDDPDGLGRVKVKLPTYNDVETDWMGVVIGGAGSGKGLIALPDVGDEVLVLFAHGDPGQGMVLGGLYGLTAPPDPGVEGGAIRRYTFVTPGGQRIRLDDDKELIRVEDSTGNSVELSPSGVTIHAAVPFTIDASGQPIVIKGKTVDFETA